MSVTKVSSAMQDLTDDYAFSGTVTGTPTGDKRNFIIDGDFTQWPEGTSATATANSTYTSAFIENSKGSDGTMTVERSTTVPTFAESGGHNSKYSWLLKCTGTDSSVGATQYEFFKYHITGSDYTALHQNQITFTFMVKTASANTGDTYYISFSNSAGDRSYATSFVATSSWTRVSKTITLDTTGTYLFTEADIGLRIKLSVLAGATRGDVTENTWSTPSAGGGDWDSSGTAISNFLDSTSNELYISQVGLYLGSTAPTFTSPPSATVQDQVDYYVQRYDYDSAAYEVFGIGGVNASTSVLMAFQFRRELRVAPTVTTSAAGTFNLSDFAYSTQPSAVAFTYGVGKNSGQFQGTVSGMTTGNAVKFNRDASDVCYIMADARH